MQLHSTIEWLVMNKISLLRNVIVICLLFLGCSKDSSDFVEAIEEPVIDYGIMKAKVSGMYSVSDGTVLQF